jgi:hypothetical protein
MASFWSLRGSQGGQGVDTLIEVAAASAWLAAASAAAAAAAAARPSDVQLNSDAA